MKLKIPDSPFSRDGVPHVTSCYDVAGLQARGGNPLDEALVPLRSGDAWFEQLLRLPDRLPSELHRPAHERAYDVAQLKRLFAPSDQHLQYANRLDLLLRWGYQYRNPLKPERKDRLQSLYERAMGGASEQAFFGEDAPICSTSLIGLSGSGKSTTNRLILRSFPQYIVHAELQIDQVVYLLVETPKDGSTKELGMNILREFDHVLGTDYAQQLSGRETAETILATVAILVEVHCLGVLVLDEIQNLSIKKSGGREEMLNWFQLLVNRLGVPVVLVGTPKARKVLGLDLRHGRRTAVMGSVEWTRLSPGDDFDAFLETVWPYQWLQKPGVLTDEMRAAVYEQTQGIRALVIDMFLVAQLVALGSGEETLTPKLFERVARSEFAVVQPMLRALRQRKLARLEEFEDMLEYDLDDIMAQAMTQMPAQPHGASLAGKAPASALSATVAHLCSVFGMQADDARRLALEVFKPEYATARAWTQAAVALHAERLQLADAVPGTVTVAVS
jgi:hypothetical protein